MSEFNIEELNLESGESVLRQTYDIWNFDGKNENGFDYLYLTNKNIIRVAEKRKKFGKAEVVIQKVPLETIIKAAQVNDEEYGNVLRIYYKDGKSDLYELCDVPKKEYPKWANAINDAILKATEKVNTNLNVAPSTVEESSVVPLVNLETTKVVQPIANNKPIGNESIVDKEKTNEIKKCPHCGERINSFIAICPACGYELNNKNVCSALEQFVSKVDEYDKLIASNSQTQTGWSSWSQSKRVWWVILNIIFIGIPFVVYTALSLLTIKSTPKLTNEEKHLASHIENFNFPNDREVILEALIFIKDKIDFISKGKTDKKSVYWMNLWCAKAEQLKQKADILFPNDNIVKASYTEIVADDERVKKTIQIKTIVGIVVLAIALILVVVRFGDFNDTSIADEKDYSSTFEWQINGIFAELPKPNTNNGKIVRETEDQISFELYNVETADFESYVKACRETGFTVDITKTDMVFYAKDEDGFDLSIFYYDDKDTMNIVVNLYESQTKNK